MLQLSFKRFFLYALLIKGILFLLFAYFFNKDAPKNNNVNYIFAFSKDYHSYIDPAINLFEKGEYFEEDKGHKLYAHKMPGMTPIFFPLYSVFGFEWALTILVLLQYLFDALCCVIIGLMAFHIFKSRRAFYIAFFLYSFSFIVSVTSHFAISELFCTNFSILSIYFALVRKEKWHYLISGFFAAWSIFFRPSSVLLLLFIPLIMSINDENKISLKQLLKQKWLLVLFFLPFVFFESIWIARNYKVMHRFIPSEMSAENFGSPGMRSIFAMLRDMGCDLQSWNPDSEMRWFNRPATIDYDSTFSATYPFPDYVTQAGVQKKDMLKLRALYYKNGDPSISSQQLLMVESAIDSLCKKTSKQFKEGAPFAYRIIAPLRVVKTLVFIKRPYGFSFISNGAVVKLIRAWHFVNYYVALVFFIIGFFWIYTKKNKYAFVITLFVISHILLYGFILRLSENRYLVPIYPYMILMATGTILYTLNYFFKTRSLKLESIQKSKG
jgi:hypothetical protein